MYNVLPTEEQLADSAADHIVQILADALDMRERVSFVLTGGQTPENTYRAIADRHGDEIPWHRVDFFWGDERFVPPDHEESNYAMSRRALLSRLPSSECTTYPYPTTLESPELAASAHELTLAGYFADREPRFDLVLLGLGADGHVASLFPGSAMLDERERMIVATRAPESSPVRDRLTMTFPLLNAGHRTVFLVGGEAKAEAVARTQRRDPIPASRIRPAGEVIWYLDQAAAAGLEL